MNFGVFLSCLKDSGKRSPLLKHNTSLHKHFRAAVQNVRRSSAAPNEKAASRH
jgi:hypothetical protein